MTRYAQIANGIFVRVGTRRRSARVRPTPASAVPATAPCVGCAKPVPVTRMRCEPCRVQHEMEQLHATAACTCGRDGFRASCLIGEHRQLAAEESADEKARRLRIWRAQA